jgi:hypothetical protein
MVLEGFYMKNISAPSTFLIVAVTMLGSLIQSGYTAPKSKYSALPARSGEGAKVAAKSNLDSATVHKYYLDGDFEEAIAILETGLREKRPFNHNDSVFIFKHLGVMYAAQYETREKGKYFMHQLLMTEPTAKIMDMYASDMIYMIFKNIQDEFDSNRMRLNHAEQLVQGNNQSEPGSKNDTRNDDARTSKQAKMESSGSHVALWWIGGIAVAAGIGGGYYLYSQSPEPAKDKEIVAR